MLLLVTVSRPGRELWQAEALTRQNLHLPAADRSSDAEPVAS
jgi:hypothetical protein